MSRHRLRHKERDVGDGSPRRVPWVMIVAALCVAGVVSVAVGAVRLYRHPVPVQVTAEATPVEAVAVVPTISVNAQMTVEIPDVTGMRSDDAQVVLRAAGLRVVVHSSESTAAESSDALLVESQEPEPGVLVSSDETVTITLAAAQAKASATKKRSRRWVVCIDPGHQAHGDSTPEAIGPGSDVKKPRVASGATGVKTRIPEYEIVLQISTNLKARLEERGVKVVMTRTTNDVNLSNAERAKIANKAGADLFIRVHGDGNPDQTVTGVSTLYPASNRWTRPFWRASRTASRHIQRATVRTTGAVDRGATPRGDLSGFNWSEVPCVLVECGFLSNSVEDRLLASPHYQDKLATGIADGVMAYLKDRSE